METTKILLGRHTKWSGSNFFFEFHKVSDFLSGSAKSGMILPFPREWDGDEFDTFDFALDNIEFFISRNLGKLQENRWILAHKMPELSKFEARGHKRDRSLQFLKILRSPLIS